jgi:NAD(P)-dependent dehydrogenase (short-subunit alcohol dehydrogenase family)
MEYWPLQQKKLGKSGFALLQGQVALITGAAGAIGFGIARQLLNNGSVVVLTDIHQDRLENARSLLRAEFGGERIQSLTFDVTDYPSVEKAFQEICRRVGGIDLVVPNAGVAYVARLEDLDPAQLDRVVAVNLKGTFNVIKAAIPIFKRQGTGGNIVVISSKNVFDPGPAFGAYSASKAGAHQLSKIAAIELADIGVRVNMVNPDAVFGDEKVCSGLWELVGPERMKSRGLDPEGLKAYYCQRSLLKKEVLPEHVGNAVVFFASDQTPTTGATLPVDSGIPGAFPR